ncbi:linear amide C-N hydrolase [Pseudoalteromonas sp. R3]|uniref:linear amide C-N hydrolase n=1 Tax=Pseudoalteromonas sp. R3 TaxID=1709477 RepID=UPI0006B67291|nr:linear amide C-N hydrolase [Pseudoalteromonas sp. R3]AZZ98608.1 linear amide C-N hydrolase [Pseudoalteromonas sp. R3]
MCTDFSIKARTLDPNKFIPVIGRSMELGPNLKSELFFRGKGFSYQQLAVQVVADSLKQPEKCKLKDEDPKPFTPRADLNRIIPNLLTWTGKFNFMALNGFATEITQALQKMTETSIDDDLYASIATNGMNDQGLTTGAMVLAQSVYQDPFDEDAKPVPSKGVVFYQSITTWILSNCATCQDVIDTLQYGSLIINANGSSLVESQVENKDKILVANPFEPDTVPSAMNFHFPVHDALGNSIVLEYVKGQLQITDLNPIRALTNDPLIGWQQENVINNYVNVVPFNFQDDEGVPDTPSVEVYKRAAHNFQCFSHAQGTGFSGLPGSSTPVDRFVRAAMMANFSFPVFQLFTQKEIDEANKLKRGCTSCAQMYGGQAPIDADIAVGKADATTLAFHILNTVDIPLGTSRDSRGKSVHDYTQWVTVSDLVNRTFAVRMYQSPQVFEFDLKKIDFKGLESCLYKLDDRIQSVNLTDAVNQLATSHKQIEALV